MQFIVTKVFDISPVTTPVTLEIHIILNNLDYFDVFVGLDILWQTHPNANKYVHSSWGYYFNLRMKSLPICDHIRLSASVIFGISYYSHYSSLKLFKICRLATPCSLLCRSLAFFFFFFNYTTTSRLIFKRSVVFQMYIHLARMNYDFHTTVSFLQEVEM